MNHIDSYTDAKYQVKSIRAIELRFDKIYKKDDIFVLEQDAVIVGTVRREVLTAKTLTLLDSLSEWSSA